MAKASFTTIIKGLEIYDRDGSGEVINILVGVGDPNGSVTAPKGSLAIDANSAALYMNTNDGTTWSAFSTGGGSAAEEGFIRAFVGKSGTGAELPDYTSENVVADNDNLEVAIGKLDAEIGAAVTGNTRTNNAVSDQAVNLNIEALDDAIGADADTVGASKSTNYFALADTLLAALAKLDFQIKTNADAIAMGVNWRAAVKTLTESNTTNDWSNVANGTALSTLLPFDDDDSAGLVLGSFADGDYVLYRDTSGTDRIYQIYDDAGTLKVTQDAGVVDALASGDTFIVSFDLADFNNSENSALYTYNGTDLVKIGDVDWALATGINLSAGFVTGGTNGTPAANDTVEEAIRKLTNNQLDLTTLTGVSQGDVDLGTFTGNIISDNNDIKGALQELETAIEAGETPVTTTTGIGGTLTDIDSVLVDEVDYAVWHVYAEGITDRSKKYAARISAIHDGTPTADATNPGGVDVDEALALEFAANKIAGITFEVVNALAAGSQVMKLQASCTEAGGMDVTVKRVTGLDV